MQDKDKVAHDIERILDATFRRDERVEITNFTPSISAGRRYIGLQIEGKRMIVQIEVEEYT